MIKTCTTCWFVSDKWSQIRRTPFWNCRTAVKTWWARSSITGSWKNSLNKITKQKKERRYPQNGELGDPGHKA